MTTDDELFNLLKVTSKKYNNMINIDTKLALYILHETIRIHKQFDILY